MVWSWLHRSTDDTSLATSCQWTPPHGRSTEPARGYKAVPSRKIFFNFIQFSSPKKPCEDRVNLLKKNLEVRHFLFYIKNPLCDAIATVSLIKNAPYFLVSCVPLKPRAINHV